MTVKQTWLLIVTLVVLFFLGIGFRMMYTTNEAGFYQVKQAAITGEMSVRKDPGMYGRWFGSVYDYKVSSGMDLEKVGTNPRFSDGSIAELEGNFRYRLPNSQDAILKIHRDFRSFDNFKDQVIENTVREALANTATLMVAEDSYSTRRAEFTSVALEQITNGIYETLTEEVDSVDTNGTKFKRKNVKIVRDANGNAKIRKISPLKEYGIEVVQFVITDFKYDKTITDLINKKKEAEQLSVVARANAEKAKNDAITESEQGKARVAKAEADALVVKKTAVIEAEQRAEVARLEAIKAEQEAKAILAKGRAQAESDKLKVLAGLTPLEKATLEKETAIGVAAELAKVRFPETMVIAGGDGKNGGTDPFTAVGLQSLHNLSKDMAGNKKQK